MTSASSQVKQVKTELQEPPVQSRPVPQLELQPSAAEQSSLRALVRRIHELERERDQLRIERGKTRATPSRVTFVVLLILGGVAFLGAIAYTSTILAFIGLGLSFYGMLFLFIRPTKYIESKILESALAPIETLDLLLTHLGYRGRGIYLAAGDTNGITLFVPEGDGDQLPMKTSVPRDENAPDLSGGITLCPPGVALARQIEEALGVDLPTRGLAYLNDKLPKVLIEDLQIVEDLHMLVDGSRVRFRFSGSLYCDQLWNDTGIRSTGCPLCSSLACVLVKATDRPVVFEDQTRIREHTFESTYRIAES